uniref:NB-ARC domain-containing protein n=1 Tax=Aegilops tauschii subsp. strangulata TaxID=200361 RepID=A0A453N3W0_AEGTS
TEALLRCTVGVVLFYHPWLLAYCRCIKLTNVGALSTIQPLCFFLPKPPSILCLLHRSCLAVAKEILPPMEGVMAASAVTGAMKTLLPKLVTLLETKYKLCRRVKKQISSLRDEMRSMNALLVKMAGAEKLDVQQKDWRDKVRELSYDMEDCIDIFTSELDGGDAKAGRLRRLRKLKARFKIAVRIEELKARVREVSDCRVRLEFHDHSGRPQDHVAIDPRVTALYPGPNSLVGIDGPKEMLIELLQKEEDAQQLKVVSVVGFGGMGKTTLVKQVYDSIKSQFHCTAFISMSQNPNIIEILRKMVKELLHSGAPGADEAELIDILRTNMENRRYAQLL